MRSRLGLGLVLGVLIVSVPLLAHHGAAQFDVGKRVTVTGTVAEWFWSNPHCFLRFDAAGEAGAVVHWVAELQSGPNIIPLGYTKQTFKVGSAGDGHAGTSQERATAGPSAAGGTADGTALPLAANAAAAANPQ